MVNEKIKVVFDHQIFCMQKYGGVSRYFYQLAINLTKSKDLIIKICCPFYVNKYIKHLDHSILIGFKSSNILEKFITSKLDRYTKKILFLMSLIIKSLIADIIIRVLRPEIIHETYYYPFRVGPKNTKRVLTVYDMIHEKFKNQFSEYDQTANNKIKAIKRADHIICISESTKKDLIEVYGVHERFISVIYLGFELSASAKLVENKALNHKPYLLYVGMRSGYKNFENFISAYSLSNYLKEKFDVICIGGGSFSKHEIQLFQNLEISNNIKQCTVEDNVLTRYYQNAFLFVYPSLYEGFGIPPLEAMHNSCPVVCSNTSSIPEVVGDAGQYFNPYDRFSILESLELVAKDPIRRLNLISEGEKQIKRFSWEKCAQETNKIYLNLLK